VPPDYQPREGVKPGAGQIRIESRLGFFYSSPQIRTQLTEIVKDSLDARWSNDRMLNKLGGSNPYNVYIFCSLAGGTGSGSFLSMAYLVEDVIRSQNHEPRVIGNLLLSTLLTSVVERPLWDNIHANTYAALKELEHLTKLAYKQIQDEGRDHEPFQFWHNEQDSSNLTTVRSRPFFMSLLYDSPGAFSVTDHEAAIADTCFMQLFTPIMGKLEGELDNYEIWMNELTRYPGRAVGRGYTKFFGAVGAVALAVPIEELTRYCSLRFAAQAIRQQITFGIDASSREDDRRVRRLQQHAVDYADPKFTNMDARQRNRVINTAFVKSARELAGIDEEDGQPTSYWATLVDRVEDGEKVIGPDGNVMTDDSGSPQRTPSLLQEVTRRIKDDRDRLMSRVEVRSKSPKFTFSRETVHQYDTMVGRLTSLAQQALTTLNDNEKPLLSKASSGTYIDDLGLDPIQERYVILRMLSICEGEWMPGAEARLSALESEEISSAKAQKTLNEDLKNMLRDAAEAKKFGLLPKIEDFNEARSNAQDLFLQIARKTENFFAARLEARQLRALHKYLTERAEQYAQLSQRMEKTVAGLEAQAARLRKGEDWESPPYALRVEVFQALEGDGDEGARERIWHRVWQALFIDGGRFLSTFDREVLSENIKEQFRDEVRADGRTVRKSPEKIEDDIRGAMLQLGRDVVQRSFHGTDGSNGAPGLDVYRALQLEAELALGEEGSRRRGAVADYVRRKVQALNSKSGVMARVDVGASGTSGDGVKLSRTRRIVLGARPGVVQQDDGGFPELLRNELGTGGRKLEVLSGLEGSKDPFTVIVHDVELGMPLYYVKPIIQEVEPSYHKLQGSRSVGEGPDTPNTTELRAFKLHVDFKWERALPNLDPAKADLAIDWTLQTLARGLVARLVQNKMGHWRLVAEEANNLRIELGTILSATLYSLEELYRKGRVGERVAELLAAREAAEDGSARAARRDKLVELFRNYLTQLELDETGLGRELDPETLRQLLLDRPALEALIEALRGLDIEITDKDSGAGGHGLWLDTTNL
jgi:hypothetical protein